MTMMMMMIMIIIILIINYCLISINSNIIYTITNLKITYKC
jgi:hypothetical protein